MFVQELRMEGFRVLKVHRMKTLYRKFSLLSLLFTQTRVMP